MSRHELLISRIIRKYKADRGCVVRAFDKALGGGEIINGAGNEVSDDCLRYCPDAFLIDPALATISVWEVEVTCPIKQHQILNLSELELCAKGYGYDLRVFSVNAYGVECEIYIIGSMFRNPSLGSHEERDAEIKKQTALFKKRRLAQTN